MYIYPLLFNSLSQSVAPEFEHWSMIIQEMTSAFVLLGSYCLLMQQ